MMKKALILLSVVALASFAEAELVRLVPEHGISKLFTLKSSDTKREYRVSFYRPDVFRVEAAALTKLVERANMKGKDVPQLIEVNLPADVQNVRYEFSADDASEASTSAKGVWKRLEYLTD